MEEVASMPSNAQEFCLRWNNFHSSLVTALDGFKNDLEFVDVTLACEGQYLKAHKMLLSACSVFFRDLLKANPCPHPIVILPPEVRFVDLEKMLRFIYQGEVNVKQDSLARFLKTAEMLKIRGLADDNDKHKVPQCSSPRPPDSSDRSGHDSTSVSPKRPRLSLDTATPSSDTAPPSAPLNEDSGGDSDSEMIPVKQEMIELKDCDFEEIQNSATPTSSQSSQPVAPPPPGPLQPSYVPPPQAKANDDCIIINPDEDQKKVSVGRAADVLSDETWRALSVKLEEDDEEMYFEEESLDIPMSFYGEATKAAKKSPRGPHNKPKEKACPICARVISSGSNLRKHIHRAHGEPTCSCFLCGKTYKATCDLRRHLACAHRYRVDQNSSELMLKFPNVSAHYEEAPSVSKDNNDSSKNKNNSCISIENSSSPIFKIPPRVTNPLPAPMQREPLPTVATIRKMFEPGGSYDRSSAVPFSALLAEDPSFDQDLDPLAM